MLTPLIIYATETGSALEAAEIVFRHLQRCHLQPRLLAASDVLNVSDLADERLVVFVVSTTGHGEMPPMIRALWAGMLSASLPDSLLSGLKVAVCGLGDSSYNEFNYAGKMLYRRLLSLGATAIAPLALCDDQHHCGVDEVLQPWKEGLADELLIQFPGQVQPYDSSFELQPRFKLVFGKSDKIETVHSDFRRLPVVANERVTTPTHFQDTRVITLKNDNQNYVPGDVIQIQPENLDESIALAIDALGLTDEVLDAEFVLQPSSTSTPMLPKHIAGGQLTLRHCFRAIFDLQRIPSRTFFESLARFAQTELERERLTELSDPKNLDDYIDYARRPRRTTAEILRDFSSTAAVIPREWYFDIFAVIQPRAFSIASSFAENPEQIQVLVAIVQYKRPYLLGERFGLCSGYLVKLVPEEASVLARIQPGTFIFPEGVSGGLMQKVCIATGTGLAPFRSLVAEEQVLRSPRPVFVFFGHRSRSTDDYFGTEWPRRSNAIVFHALSREGPKTYVQDALRKNAPLLATLIKSRKVVFYIAGSTGDMPKAVRGALVDIAAKAAAGEKENGEDLIRQMEEDKLIQYETWS